MEITRRLPNGLSLWLEPDNSLHSAVLGFVVLSGSRDEPEEMAGVAHFLEHLCFKSTPRRSAVELAQAIDALGALWNAFTWWEGTAFYTWVPSENVAPALELLIDTMRPALRRVDVDAERKVIIEEISMNEDQPDDAVLDGFYDCAYSPHPLSRRVIGYRTTVQALRTQDLQAYHREHYRPGGMVFVAQGGFDVKEVEAIVCRRCGKWRRGPDRRKRQRPKFEPRARSLVNKALERCYVVTGVPAPSLRSPLAPAAELLAGYLGMEDNSRLFRSVRQKGLADEIWSGYQGLCDTGVIYTYACIAKENLKEVLSRIHREYALASRHLDEGLLQMVKNKLRLDLLGSLEHCLERFENTVDRIAAGAARPSVESQLEMLEDVDGEKVHRLLECFPPGPCATYVIECEA